MAAVSVTHNITRHVGLNNDAPGTFQTIGSGPGGDDGDAGLQYEGSHSYTRRINATGSDHGFTYTHDATIDHLAVGNTVWLSKTYTVLTDLNEQKARVGSATTAYHEYLLGDDGTEGDDQNFLVPPRGGYILLPIEVGMTAWIQRGITGSPDLTVADVWGATWNVNATTGAGLSSSMDSIDLTDEGWFLVGGDSTDPDGNFEFYRNADEGAADATADRAGLWQSQAGIFFVYGMNVIGRTDAGTVTATVFTENGTTVVFPGGYVNAGFNGFEFDLGNATTDIDWTAVTIQGLGRTDRKVYFDTDLDVGVAANSIDITAHGFSTGDQIAYNDEGGTEDIGPDDTNGESELVGSGGPGTGDRWYVSVVNADRIQLHPTAADAYDGTSIEILTASTAGNGENHSLRRMPDTRPDLFCTGTSGAADLVSCVLSSLRDITLTSGVTLDTCNIAFSQSLALGSGTVQNCTIDQPTTPLGEAFMTVTAVSQLGDVDDNTWVAGSEGHAIEVTTTGGTQGFVGNIFTGWGVGSADDTGAHDHEFDSTSDVNEANDTITLVPDNFVTGDAVYYSDEGGTADIGLTDGGLYYVRRDSAGVYGIFFTRAAAEADTQRIALTSTGGETHVLYDANAAFHNSTGGTITLQVSGGGTAPSVRNSAGSTTIVENNVSLTISNLKDNTEVRVYAAGTTTELAGVENATDGTSDDRSVTFSLAAGLSVDIRFAHGTAADGLTYLVPPDNSITDFTWPTLTAELPITQVVDRNFDNP